MRIFCIFVKHPSDDAPWIINAWDEWTIDSNPDGFTEAVEKAKKDNPKSEVGVASVDVMDEFLDLHYAEAAPPIRRFIARVHATAEAKGLPHNCFGRAAEADVERSRISHERQLDDLRYQEQQTFINLINLINDVDASHRNLTAAREASGLQAKNLEMEEKKCLDQRVIEHYTKQMHVIVVIF